MESTFYSTEIKPVQWLQEIVQDGQPNSAYLRGDLSKML